MAFTGADRRMIPEFAVVGHPNEGKSSVLSTLAEDDSVRISPIPGETVVCQSFPVRIDGREIIRFTDTPGFQNPRKTLAILQGYDGDQENLFQKFINENRHDPALRDDCELLRPIVQGAGIIYVVDGSRPIRNVDKAEMEILRLTGLPRMAVINSKEKDDEFIQGWRENFRKSFNSIRVFNAHRATYRERIELLEALKHIDQDWLTPLEKVISAFKADWADRNSQVVSIIFEMIRDCISYSIKHPLDEQVTDTPALREAVKSRYLAEISSKEKEAHRKIRALFKHNIFRLELPDQSILHQDLFSDTTWEFLGLNRKQLVLAGGMSGAAIGVGLDLAAAGLIFGVFSSIGGVLGALTTMIGGKELFRNTNLFGIPLSRESLQIGPNTDVQFIFILLDRALLYYQHVINWAHGRRDSASASPGAESMEAPPGLTRSFNSQARQSCMAFFKKVSAGRFEEGDESSIEFRELIARRLHAISHDHDIQNR